LTPVVDGAKLEAGPDRGPSRGPFILTEVVALPGAAPIMETVAPSRALSTPDRDRLARLLAFVPASRRWAVEHRHAPLLCALGIIDAPDMAYARAAQRRFADPSETRKRALALMEELDRERRAELYEQQRNARRRFAAGTQPH
jgi:ribonuclease HII